MKNTEKPFYAADIIRNEMITQNLSYGEVAKLSGVSKSTIYGWLEQNREPQILMVQFVLLALGYKITLEKVKEADNGKNTLSTQND